MSLHTILERQLRRLGLSADGPPPDAEAWAALLRRVSTAYTEADNDRYLMERALDVSSREMRELYEARARSEARQAALREVATAVAAGGEPTAVAEISMAAMRALIPGAETHVRWIDGEVGDPPADLPPHLAAVVTGGAPRRREMSGLTEVAVPALAAGRVRAILKAIVPDDPDDAEQILTDLADLVALSTVNAEAAEHLAAKADTDALTGLANHRVFQERLELEVRRAQRHGRALSVLVGDIDEFKHVNDSYGHQVGDRVLATAARQMASVARVSDLAARIGGEEFAIILPETDGIGALTVAERIRTRLSAEPIPPVGRVTISLGVCSLADAESASELLGRADVAMYWSKANGRNASSRWTPEAAAELGTSAGVIGAQRIRALTAVRALARAVEIRNPFLRRHSDRVSDLAHALALELGWSAGRAAALRQVALIHDVGKVGLPEQLLLVPDELSGPDLERVRNHAVLGAELISELMEPEQVSWLRHHHERIDGSGYPDGLRGDDIPDGARVLAVADTWDALVSDRPYRSACTDETALDECRRVAGQQLWEPAVYALERLVARGVVEALARHAGEGSRAAVPWA